jgi:hypothetical protein
MQTFHARRSTPDGAHANAALLVFETGNLEFILSHRFGTEMWNVNKRGTPAEVAEFIERIVPMSPDPALVNSVLEELNRQLPDGVLS